MLPLRGGSYAGVFRISDIEIGYLHRQGVIMNKADGTYSKPGVSVNSNAEMILFLI